MFVRCADKAARERVAKPGTGHPIGPEADVVYQNGTTERVRLGMTGLSFGTDFGGVSNEELFEGPRSHQDMPQFLRDVRNTIAIDAMESYALRYGNAREFYMGVLKTRAEMQELLEEAKELAA